jgi:hypothetical protein
MATASPKINVVSRTVYGGSRRRKVYDAKGTVDGIEYHVESAPSKQEAITRARANVEFCQRQPTATHLGYKLFAQGAREFCLTFPHGGSYLFGADDFQVALDRLASEYHDHPEIPAFVVAAREQTKQAITSE